MTRGAAGLGEVDREAAGRLVHPGHGDAAEELVGRRVGGAGAGVPLGEGAPLPGEQVGEAARSIMLSRLRARSAPRAWRPCDAGGGRSLSARS